MVARFPTSPLCNTAHYKCVAGRWNLLICHRKKNSTQNVTKHSETHRLLGVRKMWHSWTPHERHSQFCSCHELAWLHLKAPIRSIWFLIKHNRCLVICFQDAGSVVATLQAHFTLWSSPVPVPFWPRLKRSGLSFYRQPWFKPPL